MTMLSKSKYRATRGSAEAGMSTFRRWALFPMVARVEKGRGPRARSPDGHVEPTGVVEEDGVVDPEPDGPGDRARVLGPVRARPGAVVDEAVEGIYRVHGQQAAD